MSYYAPRDERLQRALGLQAGEMTVVKFGRSTNVDEGIDTDIWDRANATDDQDIWVAPTQARVHDIVSTSANDDGDPAGTGAQTLRIFGLTDWDTAEVSEDVTLNGTTSVATTNSYVIIHRMRVLTYGSAGPNVGVITATAQTDSTVTAQINAGNGQTEMVIYGIPSTQSIIMTGLYANANRASGNAGRANIRLLVNSIPDVSVGGFITKRTHSVSITGSSAIDVPQEEYSVYPGPAIIKIQASGSATNLDISAGLYMIIKDN